jgi:hypothetical protein
LAKGDPGRLSAALISTSRIPWLFMIFTSSGPSAALSRGSPAKIYCPAILGFLNRFLIRSISECLSACSTSFLRHCSSEYFAASSHFVRVKFLNVYP